MALAALALTALIAAPASAQIEARQGTPRFDPAKQFTSPMILDIPIDTFPGAAPQRSWTVQGVSEYRCEDAWLSLLQLQRRDRKNGTAKLEVSGTVMVAESYDRFVTMRFEFIDDTGKIAGVVKNRLEAEERKATDFKVVQELTAREAEKLKTASNLKLRLTMSLLKDGAGPYIPADETHP